MRFLLLVLFANCFTFSLAQKSLLLHGRILDAETSDPVAFAGITITNTSSGTIADIDGNFTLTLSEVPVIVNVSHVGYERYTGEVSQNEFLTIRLRRSSVLLKQVEVSAGENPAHQIIQKVVANKKRNDPEQLQAFSYNSYNKFFCTLEGFNNDSLFNIKDSTRFK